LKEKVKEVQRLKMEVREIKTRTTDVKSRNELTAEKLRFGRNLSTAEPPKNIGLNTPIFSRNSLDNLNFNHHGICGSPGTELRFVAGPPVIQRFGSYSSSSNLKRGFIEAVTLTQPSFLMTQKKRRFG